MTPFIHLAYPLSVNRYWTVRRGGSGLVPTTDGRAWKAAARALARSQLGAYHQPIAGAIAVDVVLLPRTNKDGTPTERRVDIDNVCKCCLDSLEGVLFHSDAQVVDLHVALGTATPGGGLLIRARSHP